MKIFLIVLLTLIVGAGGYLYYDGDTREKIIRYVDKMTDGIHRESGMPDDPNRPRMRRVHLRKIKNTVPVGEMPIIRVKKEGVGEDRSVETEANDGDRASAVAGTIYKEKDQKASSSHTVSGKNSDGRESVNSGGADPYIAILSGAATVPPGQPDRLLIDGKIIRLYGVSLIKYALAEQELKIIADGREVSCGVISYSSNKIPYAVCFAKSVKNNVASDINLNYHLIENGFAVYKNN